MNDFPTLERVNRNQNLRKIQDPSQHRQVSSSMCILGLQQASDSLGRSTNSLVFHRQSWGKVKEKPVLKRKFE